MSNKRWLLQFHVWLGVSIGFFWALQGFTGALLVFNRDIQGAIYSREAPASSEQLLPLDAIVARASAAVHSPVKKLEAFGAKPYFLLAYYNDQTAQERTVIVDGRSGMTLDDRSTDELMPKGSGFWPWLLRFHESLLAGDRGQFIVGASGILLLLSLGIGLWNAIPAGGRLTAAFRVTRWRTLLQRFLGWHRMLGLLFSVPLILSIFCGIYLAYAPAIRPVLVKHASYVPMYAGAPQTHAPRRGISAETAWQVALRRFPGSKLVRAALPTAKSPVYFFRLLRAGEWRRWAGTSWVAVDPQSGKIIASYDAVNGPWANWITDNLYTIHTGEAGGLIARLVVLIGGLLLPAFFVTGFVTWRRKKAAKRSKQEAQRTRAGVMAKSRQTGALAAESSI